MKKKYHSVGIIPESNIKIVEQSKIDTPNRQSLTFSGLAQALK